MGAELVTGDILDEDALARAAAGCGATAHLVGIIQERRGASFETIHVTGTERVIAATRAAGASRFLYLSSLGAEPDSRTRYHQTKWAAENAVRASGLDWTILRPSVIIGPRGEFTDMLLGQVRRLPLVPVIGPGRYRMQPVSVHDVTRACEAALRRDETIGQSYDLGGPAAFSYNRMIDTIAAAMGKRRAKLHLPLPLVRLMVAAGEKLMPRPPVTSEQLTMLLEDNVCDTSPMRRELGIEPVSLDAAIRELLP